MKRSIRRFSSLLAVGYFVACSVFIAPSLWGTAKAMAFEIAGMSDDSVTQDAVMFGDTTKCETNATCTGIVDPSTLGCKNSTTTCTAMNGKAGKCETRSGGCKCCYKTTTAEVQNDSSNAGDTTLF